MRAQHPAGDGFEASVAVIDSTHRVIDTIDWTPGSFPMMLVGVLGLSMACTRRAATLIFLFVALCHSHIVHAAGDQDADKTVDAEARVMFWADGSEHRTQDGQSRAGTDVFIRRARLVVQGRVSTSLSLFVQLGQDNIGARIFHADGAIRVKDAYVAWRATDALQFAVGQFKIPFLRANLESGFNQILVDRGTLPTLRPAREGSRDLGVMAWGNLRRTQFRLALFDGSDQDAGDPATRPRVTARIAHNWWTAEPGLAYSGTTLGAARVLQVAAQLDVQNARADPRDESGFGPLTRDYRAYALEAFFEQPIARWAVTADGAWLAREDNYVDAATPTRRLRGHSAQVGVLLPPRTGPGRLQAAFRREQWESERGSAPAPTARTTAGATYYFKGHARKLQADYTHKREAPEVDNDEFRLSMAVVF